MDNSNNSNWPSNPTSNPIPPDSQTPNPTPAMPTFPPAGIPPANPLNSPVQTTTNPFESGILASYNQPAAQPGTTPSYPQNPTSSWTPPSQNPLSQTTPAASMPLSPEPSMPSFTSPTTQDNPTWNQPPESTLNTPTNPPTFNASQDNTNFSSPPMPQEQPNLGTSPLDNPWGAPVQPPAIDGSSSNNPPNSLQPTDSSYPSTPQPTWTPSSGIETPSNAIPANPTSAEQAQNPVSHQTTPTPESNPPVIQADSAPTDLSHLIGNNNGVSVAEESKNQPAAETLVVPPNTAPEVPNLPTETQKRIPKWLIGAGIGLLVIIAGASAYFILGIGQPTQQTTSIPAEVTQTPIKTAPPIETPTTPAEQPAVTNSASFGELQEDSQSSQATSAAELLRQRQQSR